MPASPPLRDDEIEVQASGAVVAGRLTVPREPRGVVVFAHGSGSSRHSPRNRYVAEVLQAAGLATLLVSDEAGPCLVSDPAHRALYIFNHFEYDSDTLKQEYDRDVANGTPINVPLNYYPDDNPAMPPLNRWRSHAHLLYGNWINEIYQSTPYEIADIGT